jgi:mevalonate kinase
MTLLSSYTASAPGSVMLTGEHAVLYGQPALVAAVDQRLKVALTPRTDQSFSITSEKLGTHQNNLSTFTITKPFEFVMTVIQHFLPRLTTGFDLQINSEFSHQVGLGSSAAVTVATLAVFSRWLQQELSLTQFCQMGYQFIHQVQKVGSGADVAASVHGGVVFYQKEPFLVDKLSHAPHLAVVYSGAKEPTPKVIAKVNDFYLKQPYIVQKLFTQMGEYTQAARVAIEKQDWQELGHIFNLHHVLQSTLGTSTPMLETLTQELRKQPGITGAKISGSGLGDCVIGVGHLPAQTFPLTEMEKANHVQQFDIVISQRGLVYE